MHELIRFVGDVLRTLVPCLLVAAVYPGVSGRLGEKFQPLLLGLLFGAASIAAMMTSVALPEGPIFDLRAVPVALAAPFGGPLAGLLAGMLAVGWRLLGIGGAGAGYAIIGLGGALCAGMALALWPLDRGDGGAAWVRRPGHRFGWTSLLALGGLLALNFLFVAHVVPWLAPLTAGTRIAMALSLVGATLLLGPPLLQDEARRNLRRRLAREAERTADIIASLPGVVYRYTVTATGEFRIDYLSPQAQALLGVPPATLLADSGVLLRMLHPADASRVVGSLRQRMAAGETVQLRLDDARIRLPDGTERRLQARGTRRAQPDGSVVSVGVLTDVTELVESRAELTEARFRAEAASRAKSAFLSVMSHEMRTPLNAILGFAEVLSHGPLDEGQREAVEHQTQAGLALLALVDDVLQFSRLEAEQESSSHEPVELRTLLAHAADRAVAAGRRRQVEVRVQVPAEVPEQLAMDAPRVLRVLQRLLDNAVKFNRPGGAVLLGARPAEGGMLRFSVADTGPGVPPNRQEAIFEPFTQADDTLTRAHGGTGLGLAIARRLVDGMGGQLGYEDRPEGGALFWFTVPAKAVSVPAAANP